MPPKRQNGRFKKKINVPTATDDAPPAPIARPRLSPEQKIINALTQRLETADATNTALVQRIEQLEGENFELKAVRRREKNAQASKKRREECKQVGVLDAYWRRTQASKPDEAETGEEDEATDADDSNSKKRSKPPLLSENRKSKQKR
eukprot:CAMPEP_0198208052 /NCGR_PEP_ID=MMETSP1445-20131203/11450_1 /TAXON_ID=36898 /ORGANISM="Pyramimonas sp., Strain CCMP2087" /LENGTH=147 /DNA_ID=CAMNT_0043881307 /DNA_START=114 /DNA_END=557 /DNA_ORIENTATION=+